MKEFAVIPNGSACQLASGGVRNPFISNDQFVDQISTQQLAGQNDIFPLFCISLLGIKPQIQLSN